MKKLFYFLLFTALMLSQNALTQQAQQTLGKWVIPAAYDDGSNPIAVELTFHNDGAITEELLTPVPVLDPDDYFRFSAGGYDPGLNTNFFILGEYFCIPGGV